MTNRFIRDVKEVIRRLRNRGIVFDGNRQYPAIPTIDDTLTSHTNALRALREAVETHERRNRNAALDSFVRLYELEDVLGGLQPAEFGVPWATHEEVDAGAPRYKAVDPETGAYAYDRLRHVGQHAAGKGTQTVSLTIVGTDPSVTSTVQCDCALSNVFRVVLTDAVMFSNPINPIGGQVVNVTIKQDATGGWGMTFDTKVKVAGTLDTTASAATILSMQYDEVDDLWRGVLSTGFA